MLFISWMAFLLFFVPLCEVYRREKGIGDCLAVIHFGDVHAVGQWECFFIEACSTDDENFFFPLAGGKGICQRMKALGIRKRYIAMAQYDVTALRQCTFGERLEGFASHDYGVACSKALEALQVVGKAIEQMIPKAYSPVSVDGYDKR